MRHIIYSVPIVAFLFTCLVFSQQTSAQDELDTIRVVSQPVLAYANTYLAENEGLFEEQGITIEYVALQSSNDATSLAALLSGEVDLLQASISPGLVNAIIRDGNVKAVAVSAYIDPDSCPYWSFFTAAGKSADFNAESLRGTSVSVSNGIAQYYLYRLLEQYGLTLEDITVEQVPAEARGEALNSGAISLAWSTEPRLTSFRRDYAVEDVAQAQELMPNSEVSALLIGPTLLERDDDLLARYLAAYLQGSRLANAGPTEQNIAVMADILGFEPDLLAEACWPKFRETGELNESAALEYIQWMDEQDLIDEVISIDALYDPSYLEQAHALIEAMPEADS